MESAVQSITHPPTEVRLRPRTILLPLLNLSVAPDLLTLAAGLIAGSEPFLSRQAAIVVLAVVTVPRGRPPAEGRSMARAYRAMLGYLPATITAPGACAPGGDSEAGLPQVQVHKMIKVAPTVAQGIREAVRSEAPDLLLLHWKGHASNPEHDTFGETLDDLLYAPPCNIAVTRPGRWQAARHLLLPLRGGPSAELAFDLGAQLARNRGLARTVLHGVPRVMPIDAGHRQGDAPYLALLDLLAQQESGTAAPPVRQVITLASEVPATIADHTHPDDLVILGLPDMGAHAPLVQGLVLTSVLDNPDQPVLLVRAVRPLDLGAYRTRISGQAEAERSAEQWFVENSYHCDEFADGARWAAIRQDRQAHITVVLPTHNDAARIVPILLGLRRALQLEPDVPIADQILVIDTGSTDNTPTLAAAQGIPVLQAGAAASHTGPAALLPQALNLASGDIFVWLDPKAGQLHPGNVPALVGPLLVDPQVQLVKPFWGPHPADDGDDAESRGAPAFTPVSIADLLAMPLPALARVPIYSWMRAFYPRLGAVRNPLGRVFAARISLLRSLLPTLDQYEAHVQVEGPARPFASPSTAFFTGLVLETAARFSTRAIAQMEMQRRPTGRAARRAPGPDVRQLRQVAELLTVFATRPEAALHLDTLQQLRARILHASA